MNRRRLEDSDDDSSEISALSILSSELTDLESNSQDSDFFENEEENENIEIKIPLSTSYFKDELYNVLVKFFTESEKYVKEIKNMCALNFESIDVDYMDIVNLHETLENEPEIFIKVLSDALTHVTKIYFPSYFIIKPVIHGRIHNLPVLEDIRGLRNIHLNKLIRINGVVTRRSGIFSLYSIVKFTCTKCQATFGPFIGKDVKPTSCFECQCNGPFVINTTETIYKDFQKLTVQEIPGTVASGSLPRSKDVLLYYDLIDSVKPGDEVDITGVYKNNFSLSLNIKNGFPVFSTMIDATSVKKRITKMEMTDDDIREIRELGKHPNIVDILVDNFAPSIFGHRSIKTSILLSMVGGNPKEKNGMRIRGDINVLLLGDPGTAKSQFLRYVEKTSHRAVMATGQGSSGVGLTASVQKDIVTKEWTLEGGALVLADKGVCMIDEFDKMNDTDRTSIHEAMEQQSISISKAGIIATLHARCSVIAAANPTRGKYNPALSFAQNINLSDPIISRFDLLCVVKDNIDAKEDTTMAEFILNSHGVGSDSNKRATMSQDLLKKYILYARNEIVPSLSSMDNSKITNLYSDLRRDSLNSGIPITVRHIESIIRVSEAFAKLRLSNTVSKSDIDLAISLTLDSFLNAQRFSVSKQLRNKFSKYFEGSNDDLIIYLLKDMIKEKLEALGDGTILKSEFITRCKHSSLIVSSRFFESDMFISEGFELRGENILRSNIN